MAAKKDAVSAKRVLRVEYSGNLIKHLGLAMYGGPVPALAELISNAWDADASRVDIKIAFGRPWTDTDHVTLKDNGRGMSWEDVARQYLVIGRDRRAGGAETTPSGRPVMGRKGIGKLAGFGIAKIVELRTVRNKWITHFSMDYREMTAATGSRRYEPTVIADGPIDESNSTTVILRDLYYRRAINERQFTESMGRRFAVLSDSFKVFINKKPLSRTEVPLAERTPEAKGALLSAEIPEFGTVTYWYGFTKQPIPVVDARGIAVMVRGRMAQQPFFFNISGGVYNQLALEYLTGEVYADELDAEADLISTDRQTINWTEQGPAALEKWGQKLIRDAARQYDQKVNEQADARFISALETSEDSNLAVQLANLRPSDRKTADAIVRNLRRATAEKDGQKYAGKIVKDFLSAQHRAANLSAALHDLESDHKNGVAELVSQRLVVVERELSRGHWRVDMAAAVLRENTWLLHGPWRNIIHDSTLSKRAQDAANLISSLSTSHVMIARYERTLILAAITQAPKDLARPIKRLIRTLKLDRIPSLYIVTTDGATIGKRAADPTIRLRSFQQILSEARRACHAMQELMRNHH